MLRHIVYSISCPFSPHCSSIHTPYVSGNTQCSMHPLPAKATAGCSLPEDTMEDTDAAGDRDRERERETAVAAAKVSVGVSSVLRVSIVVWISLSHTSLPSPPARACRETGRQPSPPRHACRDSPAARLLDGAGRLSRGCGHGAGQVEATVGGT